MDTKEKESHSREQAKAQLESIREMLAAVNCDYDRLEELKDEREGLAEAVKDAETELTEADKAADHTDLIEAMDEAKAELTAWDELNGEELKELTEAAGECESEEDARERIQEDPLSVEVRGDWHEPGAEDGNDPTHFTILLCTGGPACRIVGELDEHKQPRHAWMEHQDWGTPWTEYYEKDIRDDLVAYASHFYFGD